MIRKTITVLILYQTVRLKTQMILSIILQHRSHLPISASVLQDFGLHWMLALFGNQSKTSLERLSQLL